MVDQQARIEYRQACGTLNRSRTGWKIAALKQPRADFLMFSQEALNQMDPSSPGRASTYNLFTRFLVEGGLAALVLFVVILVRGLHRAARNDAEDSLFARLLTLGSLGFLLTQDTYFYPPLCLGLALCYSFHGSGIAKQAQRVAVRPMRVDAGPRHGAIESPSSV